jgi:hypothetical protein
MNNINQYNQFTLYTVFVGLFDWIKKFEHGLQVVRGLSSVLKCTKVLCHDYITWQGLHVTIPVYPTIVYFTSHFPVSFLLPLQHWPDLVSLVHVVGETTTAKIPPQWLVVNSVWLALMQHQSDCWGGVVVWFWIFGLMLFGDYLNLYFFS